MTACVNKKHTRRVALAISASLVGALSLGAAAPAFAANDGISTMALDPEQAVREADVTLEDSDGNGVTIPEKGTLTVNEGTYVTAKTLQPKDSETVYTIDTTGSDANARLIWRKADNTIIADTQAGTDPDDCNWAAGEYKLQIILKTDDQFNGGSKTINFKVVGNKLDEAEIFNNTDGKGNAANTSFVWNQDVQKVGVSIDGVALDENEDYDLKVIKAGGSVEDADATVQDAGDYIALVYNEGEVTTGTPVKEIPFTVEKLNLTTASVSIDDVEVGDPKPAYVIANGCKLQNYVTIDISAAWGMTGEYTAIVSVNNENDRAKLNVEGSTTVTFNVVEALASTAYYGATRNSLSNDIAATYALDVDLSKPATAFDPTRIRVLDDGGKRVADDSLSVWYTNADGSDATLEDLGTPGSYVVHVRVDAQATEMALGSVEYLMKVDVKGGTVDSDQDVVFKYKGDVTDKVETDYTGSNVMNDIDIVVRFDDEELVAGEDYKVEIKNTDTGKVVDGIVDAGNYTITLSSDAYEGIDGESIQVKVNPIDFSKVYATCGHMVTFTDAYGNEHTVLPYTGSAIEQDFSFYYLEDKDNDGEAERYDLPEGVIEVASIDWTKADDGTADEKDVDEISDKGFYILNLELAKDVKNFKFSAGADETDTIEVSAQKVYSDVPNNMWYSPYVYTAGSLGYMNGFNGTSFFGPEQNITRGDVAVVLYKMAGGTLDADGSTPGSSDDSVDNKGYQTGFSDVDPDVYYAQAIAWAENAGIVTGYDGTDLFMPDANISRQELATMLARYAKLKGDDVTADLSELDAYTDGSAVADFADEAVAWAVESGIMGQDVTELRPADAITRAEVAAMAVRMQPKALENDNLVK